MKPQILYISLFVAVFASCRVPELTTQPVVNNMPDTFSKEPNDTSSIANLSWRKFFSDRYLVALIDTALANNPDLRIAMQRINIARAQLYLRKAAFYPSVDGVISAGVDRFGDYTMNGVGNFDTNLSPNIKDDQKIPRSPTPDFFVGLRSSWEVDLWGKLKSRKAAAAARLLATEKGRHLVTTNIVSTIATLYYELLALDQEIEIVNRNIVLQEEALEVVKVQKEGGRATELAVQQFSAQLLNTKGIAFALRQQQTEVENQINEIMGRFPQSVARDTVMLQKHLTQPLTIGEPSQLLIRRPDIQQAEYELRAARADVKAARAAFLPSLNLSPYAGFHSFKAGLLFDPGSIAAGVVAGLTAPLINRRQVKGEYNIAGLLRNEQVYNYQKVLFSSYNEVVTNLRLIENTSQALQLKTAEVQELSRAVATARDLYLTGYANYLEVITAQKGVLSAEIELTENRKQLLQGMIALYRSLGGGWN